MGIKRFLFSLGLSFTVTVAAGEFWIRNSKILLMAGELLFFVSVFLFAAAGICRRRPVAAKLLPLAFVLLASSFGALRWGIADGYASEMTSRFAGETVEMTLVVTGEETVSRNGTVWYTAEAEAGNPFRGKVRFPDSFGLNPEPFDRIRGCFFLKEPYGGRSENVLFYASLQKQSGYDIVRMEQKLFGNFFVRLRRYVKQTLSYYLADASGFACAMMTGDTSGLSDRDYTDLSRAGLLHVTAVSGLHVGILASMVLLLIKPVGNPCLKAFVCCGCVFLLCGVSGFSTSAVRASLMSGFSFLPEFYPGMKIRYEPLNGLGLAAILILSFRPLSVGSASFLLSFASTLGVLVLSGPLTEHLSTFVFLRFSVIPGRALSAVICCISVSVSCFVFSAPVTLLLFDSVTPAGVLSNLFVFFIIPTVFLLCAAILLLSSVSVLSPVCRALAVPVRIGVNYMTSITRTVAALDVSSFTVGPNHWWIVLVLLVLAAAAFCLLVFGRRARRKKQKRTLAVLSGVTAGLSAVVCSFVFLISFSGVTGGEDTSELQIAFLNVGQGNCVVVNDGDLTVVYDCGGTVTPAKTAEQWLRQHRIDDIDYLVVSHLHDDHANGVAALCDSYPVGTILIPDAEGEAEVEASVKNAAEKHGILVRSLSEDETLPSSGAEMKLLTKHIDPASEDQNENCLVLKVDDLDFTALLTGDITAAAEKRILENYGAFSVDLLSVPHHGSAYSSSEEFLFWLVPSVSVISVGEGNTYGHPDDAVVSRLLSYGTVYMTKDCGTVTVRSDGRSFSLSSER